MTTQEAEQELMRCVVKSRFADSWVKLNAIGVKLVDSGMSADNLAQVLGLLKVDGKITGLHVKHFPKLIPESQLPLVRRFIDELNRMR